MLLHEIIRSPNVSERLLRIRLHMIEGKGTKLWGASKGFLTSIVCKINHFLS